MSLKNYQSERGREEKEKEEKGEKEKLSVLEKEIREERWKTKTVEGRSRHRKKEMQWLASRVDS